MASYVKVSSSWKTASSYYVKVGGAWKTVSNGYVKIAGAWKSFFQLASLSLTASNITATNATFTITSSAYAYFKLSISPAAFAQQLLGTSTTYTTTALSANTIYTATVQGWTEAGYTGFTTTASTAFTTAPATPSISKFSYTPTSVTMQWSAISGATSYYVSTDGTSYTDAGNVTSYNFTGLSNGTLYTFYVKAYRSSTNLYSAADSRSEYTAPGIPTLNNASSITHNSATLSWSGGTGTGSYQLYVRKAGVNISGSPFYYSNATTSVSVSLDAASTTYTYQLLAYTRTDWSNSFSYASPDTKSFTTSASPLVAPSGGSASIAVSSGTAGRVTSIYSVTKTNATGNPSPGEPTYQWQRSTSTPGVFNNISPGGTSSTYTIAYADVQLLLRCIVTWTNSQGSQVVTTNGVSMDPPTVTGVVSRYYATSTGSSPGFAEWTVTGYNFQSIRTRVIVNGTTQALPATVSGVSNNSPGSGITRFTGLGSSTSSYALIFRPERDAGGNTGNTGVTSTTNIIFNSASTRANNPNTNTFTTTGSVVV